jgi:hypothetical protein
MPSPGDDQMPQSLASSQTVVGTSVDPGTGYRTSFKRKRDNSPSDFARNLQPFVAGSDGDSLPHYLTVSPAVPWLFSHIECEYRFLKVGNQFCSKSGVCLACFGGPTVDRQGYTWGVLWELVRIHCLHSNQGITPKACRNLMGKNAIVGPNVKEIILETRLEECPISDLGKAEHDAQVREFILDCVFLWANGHKSPWEHLDSEESLPDGNSTSPLKFGGHVEFVVRVTESLNLQQQQPRRCPSSRFGRRFGSSSFVKLAFSKEALEKLRKQPDGLLNFVRRPIIITGGVFRAYSTRDSNVFYVQTNEVSPDTERMRQWLLKDPFPQSFSFLEFIRWHNPLEYNRNQVTSTHG